MLHFEIKLLEVTRMELETDWLVCYESLKCYCISNPFNDEFVMNTSFSLQATVGIWNAGKNNMGFGFNRETWNVIKGCAEVGIIILLGGWCGKLQCLTNLFSFQNFCSYDDYNWDWSLNTLGTACLGRPLKVLVVKAPRILHIGTW